MDFPDELRVVEELLKQAEKEFLAGNDGIAEALLGKISTGTFSSDAETARARMQSLDESRYVKWSRWVKKNKFSASFWKDEGYPSIDPTTLRASNPDWYSKRTGTTKFVKDLMIHRNILPPTVDGERKGSPTPLGKPSNRWLLDFVALIVMKRAQTSLILVAERLGLTIHEILDIAREIKNLDDRVIEHDGRDSSKNLTYLCRKPDSSLTPLVDITV
ncbi:MAG: hypothetical protein ACXAB6_03570 [Candidatus Thorarchaeota archaeon]|jgi:hypothetical protein